ncbi:hypothetical protein [Vibrio scophthalmi]|uniref:Uncharacterized protein n=1 Tax=Vibrio scophthalmi LMG 19158 TaxID=870967 RepID=F9RQN4_9VIBR|nr:hypothetical protein [Vibrio scophthalmi]EGU33965.1 hypothetical protein VIS19158_10929 [Vibrio scophthalmi LMG 19158]
MTQTKKVNKENLLEWCAFFGKFLLDTIDFVISLSMIMLSSFFASLVFWIVLPLWFLDGESLRAIFDFDAQELDNWRQMGMPLVLTSTLILTWMKYVFKSN